MPRRKKVETELDGLPKLLGAEIYKESSWFVCLLPNDVHQSVVGRGESVADAVNAWDVNLKGHLRNAADDDPVVVYVKLVLNKPVEDNKVPSVVKGKTKVDIKKTRDENMAEFMAQFIPPKRYRVMK